MRSKLLAGLVPLLAMAAFVAVPAAAQAETKAYGTLNAEGKFKAFKENTATAVTSKSTTTFRLEAASGAAIECTALADSGTVTNKKIGTELVGTSEETLKFTGCTVANGPLAGCKVASTATGTAIEGAVTNLVTSETTVEIKVTLPGFTIVTTGAPAGCPAGFEVGKVTGSATGNQAAGTNLLVFTKATGLKLNEEAATITGSDELLKGKKAVLIN